MTNEEMQRAYMQQQMGLRNMTNVQRIALQQQLAQQQSPLWSHMLQLTGGAIGAPFVDWAVGNPQMPTTRLQTQQQRAMGPAAWLPDTKIPETIDDPLPWVGWSYLWRGCCALGALGAWAGFVLFLCWIAR